MPHYCNYNIEEREAHYIRPPFSNVFDSCERKLDQKGFQSILIVSQSFAELHKWRASLGILYHAANLLGLCFIFVFSNLTDDEYDIPIYCC
jgi:hypothetical protein